MFLTGLASATGACRKTALSQPGVVLIANEVSRTVAVIDLDTLQVRRQVSFESPPTAVIAHPTRDSAFVLTPKTGAVHEIDVPDFSVVRRHRFGVPLHSIRLSVDGEWLWALSRDSQILAGLRIDTWKTGHRIRLPGSPEDFDLSRDHHAAVSFPDTGQAGVWDLNKSRQLHLTRLGGRPSTLRFRPDGRQLLAGLPDSRLIVILESHSGKTVTRLPLAIEPSRFCFKSDGGVLFVSGRGTDAVAAIYPYRDMVAETFLAGKAPGAMAVSAGLSPLLFVANPESGDVTVIDITTSKLLATVAVGSRPSHIAVTPDDRYALVLNHDSGDVAVLLIEALRNRRVRPAPPPVFTMLRVGSGPVSAAVKVQS